MATIDLPDHLLDTLQLTPDDLKTELALSLYQQGRLSIQQALNLANVWPSARFYELLAEREILPHRSPSTTDNQTISLLEVIERLQKIDNIVHDFLVEISFELRTPANAVDGYAQYLLEVDNESLTDFQKETLSILRESAQYLMRNVNQILDQARLGGGWFKLSIEQINLLQLIDRIKGTISNYLTNDLKRAEKAKYKRIKPEVEYNIPAELPSHIWADWLQILYILIEVLLEAVRVDREQEGKVIFTAYHDDHQITIKIVDDGIGLPEHLRDWMPHLPPSCASIIKLHRGHLDLIAQENGGWTMTLILPIYHEQTS